MHAYTYIYIYICVCVPSSQLGDRLFAIPKVNERDVPADGNSKFSCDTLSPPWTQFFIFEVGTQQVNARHTHDGCFSQGNHASGTTVDAGQSLSGNKMSHHVMANWDMHCVQGMWRRKQQINKAERLDACGHACGHTMLLKPMLFRQLQLP